MKTLGTDLVADVVDKVGEAIHLVGHSYGGLTTFASALSGKVSPLSLVAFEANPIYSKRNGSEFPWKAETTDVVERFNAAYALGDPDTKMRCGW